MVSEQGPQDGEGEVTPQGEEGYDRGEFPQAVPEPKAKHTLAQKRGDGAKV